MSTDLTEKTPLPPEAPGGEPAQQELLIVGLGGAGIVTMGDILARAAMNQYPHVTWYPCYNTMMRGGDSECCVVFSQESIASPIVYLCATVIAMNAELVPALEDRVAPGGLLIVDSLTQEDQPPAKREGLRSAYVPATETARRIGRPRNANLVMMGAYVGITGAISPDLVETEMKRSLQSKGLPKSAISAGKEAFAEGLKLAENYS